MNRQAKHTLLFSYILVKSINVYIHLLEECELDVKHRYIAELQSDNIYLKIALK